jgi:hypothetical protein
VAPQKPRVHLPAVTGVPESDLQVLSDLYEKLTGKKPTPQELAEAQVQLEREGKK